MSGLNTINMRITKSNIEKIKLGLDKADALMYRCWRKNIIHESSVKEMGGEIVNQIIKYEGTKITSFGYDLKK